MSCCAISSITSISFRFMIVVVVVVVVDDDDDTAVDAIQSNDNYVTLNSKKKEFFLSNSLVESTA